MKFAIFLDFDGTITKENMNSWQFFRKKYKMTPGPHFEQYSKEKTKSGMEKIIKEWTSYDYTQISKIVTEEDISNFIEDTSVYRDGLLEFSELIKGDNKIVYTAVISGGYPDVVKGFAKGMDWKVFTHDLERDGADGYRIVTAMHGATKQKIMEAELTKLSDEYGEKVMGIYFADEPLNEDGTQRLKGYELSDYGKNIIRIHMGGDEKSNGGRTVQDFYEAITELEKITVA